MDDTLSRRRRNLDPVDILALIAFSALLVITALSHEIGHDEAQAWNIARAAAGMADVLETGRHEGHTPAWHALLWIAGRAGGVWLMQALAIAATLVFAVLLLRDRPFGRTFGLLILCGYFVAYEYPIVARPYVITLALSAVLASLVHRDRARDPLLPAVVCGLVASLSAFSALLSAALMVAVIGFAHASGVTAGRLVRALVPYLILLGLAAWFVLTPFDDTGKLAGEVVAGEKIGRQNLVEILRTPTFPHVDRLPLGVGAWVGGTWAGAVLTGAATLAALLAVAWAVRRERTLVLAWLTAIALIAAGAWWTGLASERHLGHLFVAAIVLCWMGAGTAPVPPERPLRRPADRLATVALLGVLGFHAAVAAGVVALDLRRPLTPWKATGAELAKLEEPYTLLTYYAYYVGGALAYADRPVHDIACDCLTRHHDWSRRAVDDPVSALGSAWCALIGRGENPVLILANEARNTLFADDDRLEPIAVVPGGVRDGESSSVRLWRPNEVERERCLRARP